MYFSKVFLLQKKIRSSSIFSKISLAAYAIVFSLFCYTMYINIFLSPSLRTFWPYMIGTYLIALLAYFYFNQGTANIKKDKPLEFLFSKKIWLSRSSIQDYFIITINHFLISYFLQSLALQPSFYIKILDPVFKYVDFTIHSEEPTILVLLSFSFFSFLLSDLMYFFAHKLMHNHPCLWEFHKIHHSAETMTPLTVYRAHPVELLILTFARTFGYGIIAAIFLYFYPNMKMLGIVIVINTTILFINAALANLRHSHVWISYGPIIEKFILSPAQHQIHHSTQRKHYDKNFGSTLAVWDYAFNSLYVTKKHEEVTFGLGDEKEKSQLNSIWDLYITPFKLSLELLRKNKSKK